MSVLGLCVGECEPEYRYDVCSNQYEGHATVVDQAYFSATSRCSVDLLWFSYRRLGGIVIRTFLAGVLALQTACSAWPIQGQEVPQAPVARVEPVRAVSQSTSAVPSFSDQIFIPDTRPRPAQIAQEVGAEPAAATATSDLVEVNSSPPQSALPPSLLYAAQRDPRRSLIEQRAPVVNPQTTATRPLVASREEPANVTSAAPQPAIPTSEPNPPTAGTEVSLDLDQVYTVQLGAFSTVEAAQRRATVLGLMAGQGGVARILVGGEVRFVLAWGLFETRADATAVITELEQQNNVKIDHWVRPLGDLQRLSAEADRTLPAWR